MPRPKQTVLFICSHNSARSQMAEGMMRTFYGDRYEAFSAGTQPGKINLNAIRVMKEIGIDISKQKAKSVEEYYGKDLDLVVTLCDEAEEECPFFIEGKDYIHEGLKDPATAKGTEEQVLKEFRASRDEIRQFLKSTFGRSR
ncbi:MAG: Protein ArsC [Methanomassiliicoccales archaeon PtaU1.Bin124]|nr:MAG: Protein ArsC [Methanomassiliicoccales archaeon PtaU1.Bin124]